MATLQELEILRPLQPCYLTPEQALELSKEPTDNPASHTPEGRPIRNARKELAQKIPFLIQHPRIRSMLQEKAEAQFLGGTNQETLETLRAPVAGTGQGRLPAYSHGIRLLLAYHRAWMQKFQQDWDKAMRFILMNNIFSVSPEMQHILVDFDSGFQNTCPLSHQPSLWRRHLTQGHEVTNRHCDNEQWFDTMEQHNDPSWQPLRRTGTRCA